MLGDLVYGDFSDRVRDWNTLEETLKENNILPSVRAYDVDNVLKYTPDIDVFVLDKDRKMFRVHIGAQSEVLLALGMVWIRKDWDQTFNAAVKKIQMGYLAWEDLHVGAQDLWEMSSKAELMRKNALSAYKKMQVLGSVLSVNMMFMRARCEAVISARAKCVSEKNLLGVMRYMEYLSSKR